MIKKIVIPLIMFINILTADQWCMDNSKHTDPYYGPDYKNYYHTQCMCPCDRYEHSYNRGRCQQCLHFRGVYSHYIPPEEV